MAKTISHVGIAILTALVVFMAGMLLLNPFMEVVSSTYSDLSCSSSSSISDGNRALCLIVDAVVPYAILVFISLSAGYITSKTLE